MRPTERTVAGLTCSEVLADLSRYLDGDLAPDRRAQIEAHVSECQACSEFGQAFGGMIDAVRARLREPEPVPAEVAERLKAALAS
ncbi:MAG: zf-HC2 domain-containing protein [Acidobacteriota bacterium]|nr:zf-HC2 domain-containing protein [Acidobacteriota bacterium]